MKKTAFKLSFFILVAISSVSQAQDREIILTFNLSENPEFKLVSIK